MWRWCYRKEQTFCGLNGLLLDDMPVSSGSCWACCRQNFCRSAAAWDTCWKLHATKVRKDIDNEAKRGWGGEMCVLWATEEQGDGDGRGGGWELELTQQRMQNNTPCRSITTSNKKNAPSLCWFLLQGEVVGQLSSSPRCWMTPTCWLAFFKEVKQSAAAKTRDGELKRKVAVRS